MGSNEEYHIKTLGHKHFIIQANFHSGRHPTIYLKIICSFSDYSTGLFINNIELPTTEDIKIA